MAPASVGDRYLHPDDLSSYAERWAADLGVTNVPPSTLHAPALLVLDMQHDFLDDEAPLPVWGGRAAAVAAAQLLAAFRDRGLPVVFSQHHCIEPFKHKDTIGTMKDMASPENFLRAGSRGASIVEAVDPRPGEPVIVKYRYSAFFGSPLETLLRVWGVREVVVTGVATNICCETTAHDAFFRGFEVVMSLDATGATDEDAHMASLRNILRSYGRVLPASRIITALPGA